MQLLAYRSGLGSLSNPDFNTTKKTKIKLPSTVSRKIKDPQPSQHQLRFIPNYVDTCQNITVCPRNLLMTFLVPYSLSCVWSRQRDPTSIGRARIGPALVVLGEWWAWTLWVAQGSVHPPAPKPATRRLPRSNNLCGMTACDMDMR